MGSRQESSEPDCSKQSTRTLQKRLGVIESQLSALRERFPGYRSWDLGAMFGFSPADQVPPWYREIQRLSRERGEIAAELSRRGKLGDSESPRSTTGDANILESKSKDPRTMVKAYMGEVLRETGRRITKKDIWTKAGYRTRTEFERWERQDAKHPNKAADETFRRILTVEKPHLK